MAGALKAGCRTEIETVEHGHSGVGTAEHQGIGIVEDGFDPAIIAA